MSEETDKKPKKAGRPPKINAGIIEGIAKYIRSGASFEDAMIMSNLSEQTLYDWKKKGKEKPESIYGSFLEEITHARTEAKMRKIASVETKCREDGTFALEMLSRAYPEEYGRKDRITVDANVDAKVATTSDIVMGLSPEAVARYRANRDSILGKTKKA